MSAITTAIYWIAKWIGWRTSYHICCTYPAANGGMAIMDMTITVKPWITRQSMDEVRAFLHKEAGSKSIPSITSITRIGT